MKCYNKLIHKILAQVRKNGASQNFGVGLKHLGVG